MARPIQKKWFGIAPVAPGNPPYAPDAPPGVIQVNGGRFADGTTFGPTAYGTAAGYIVKQTGAAAYVIQDEAMAHAPEILFMVNATTLAALEPGQCFILARPFGGSALPCEKIQQFRLSVYTSPNSTTPYPVGQPAVQPVANYSWSTIPADDIGDADLIT